MEILSGENVKENRKNIIIDIILWIFLVPIMLALITFGFYTIIILFGLITDTAGWFAGAFALLYGCITLALMFVANFIRHTLSLRNITNGEHSGYIDVFVIVSLVGLLVTILSLLHPFFFRTVNMSTTYFGMMIGIATLFCMIIIQSISYKELKKNK